MSKDVKVKDIVKHIKTVQARHQVVQQMLAELLEALNLLDPKTALQFRPGKSGGWGQVGHQCRKHFPGM